ncbi:NYN domain-containing protein [Desulfofundulus thermocisternus]|uniref:NYN domain-containing protein n=1 Tax=Desulfofundulus thermocisternus TaxID=42471 RepID=UPI0019FFAF18|nr:NYN domain-containing protein [Thermoanaerobacter sp.]
MVGYLAKRQIPGVQLDPANPSTYIYVEKETDVNIATDLTKAFFNAYDTAVLVSADSDYSRGRRVC